MKKMTCFLLLLMTIKGFSQDSLAVQKEMLIKSLPVLWHQTAAEYRALCYQAFNFATLRLKQEVAVKHAKPMAIITDLDETILDNSYSEAKLIKEGKSYTGASWKAWVNQSAATAVPGAVAFLQLAAGKGVEIFYISNRDSADLQATLVNLQKLHLPNTDFAHMPFMKNGQSSKEARRKAVMEKYDVIILLGDNLNDFMEVFEGRSVAERYARTDQQREAWGKKFIVLPNSIYGEWENALYDYKRLTPAQKQEKRLQQLAGY